MSAFWSATALLPDGWAQNVRFTVVNGRIVSIETGRQSEPNDATHQITLPGLANVHSHAFNAAWPGLQSIRVATATTIFGAGAKLCTASSTG